MMTFIIIIAGVVSLIGSRCFFIERWRRKRLLPLLKPDPMPAYEEFEKIVLQMIEATSESRLETQDRMREFYVDHPPPYPRQSDLKRALRC